MMNSWKFRAINRLGLEVSGSFYGAKQELYQYFTTQRLHAYSVKWNAEGLYRRIMPRAKFTRAQLSAFFMDAHHMHMAGLGVSHILESMAESAASTGQREVLVKVRMAVQAGESLSRALETSEAFPDIVPMVIGTGEKSGRLGESLEMLSRHFERVNEAHDKLAQALTYPVILFVVLVGVGLFVGVQLVPRLQGLLPEGGTNAAIKSVELFSQAIVHYWWVWGALLLVGGGLLICKKGNMESVLYKVPRVGALLKEQQLAEYFANLSALLGSGHALLPAMEHLRRVNQTEVGRHFYSCREYILSGLSLWEALQRDPFFPAAVSTMVRRGEESARLETYCHLIAGYFSKRVQSNLNTLINLIQPALMLLGGLFLTLIATGFLMPIYANLSKIAGG